MLRRDVPASRARRGTRRVAVRRRVSAPARRPWPDVSAARADARIFPPNRRPPSRASAAGIRVIDTARAIRLVIARLGPNVWKNSSRPTTSAATPPATTSPRGEDDGHRARGRGAGCGSNPLPLFEFAAHRRHEEDRVVGHEAQEQDQDQRLDLLCHAEVEPLAPQASTRIATR